MLVWAATGAWLAAIAADGAGLVRANVVVSVVALIVLAAGLVLRLPVTIPFGDRDPQPFLGFETDALDPELRLVAAALLAIAELAYWSDDSKDISSTRQEKYLYFDGSGAPCDPRRQRHRRRRDHDMGRRSS